MESDFSRFHRVDDMYALAAAVFFSRATRLVAYGGVMTGRVARELDDTEPPTAPPTPLVETANRAGGNRLAVGAVPPGAKVVDFAALRAMNPDLFEVLKVGG